MADTTTASPAVNVSHGRAGFGSEEEDTGAKRKVISRGIPRSNTQITNQESKTISSCEPFPRLQNDEKTEFSRSPNAQLLSPALSSASWVSDDEPDSTATDGKSDGNTSYMG